MSMMKQVRRIEKLAVKVDRLKDHLANREIERDAAIHERDALQAKVDAALTMMDARGTDIAEEVEKLIKQQEPNVVRIGRAEVKVGKLRNAQDDFDKLNAKYAFCLTELGYSDEQVKGMVEDAEAD